MTLSRVVCANLFSYNEYDKIGDSVKKDQVKKDQVKINNHVKIEGLV